MAHITVVVAKKFSEVWKSNPHVTQIVEVDTTLPLWKMSDVNQSLHSARRKYSVVIDLQRNVRSFLIRRNVSKLVLLYSKYRSQKIDLVYRKRFPKHTIHVVHRYFDAVKSLGIEFQGEKLEYWMEEDKFSAVYIESSDSALSTQAICTVGLAPGAHHLTKRWLTERYAELAANLCNRQHQVVLIGGESDLELCNNIERLSGSPLQNRAGATTLEQTARAIDTCDVIVSNDSGVLHLAAARRKPVVAIYGSTVPEFGFTPFGVEARIIQADLTCRPCTHIGRSACPRKHFDCMSQIGVQEVEHALDSLRRRRMVT